MKKSKMEAMLKWSRKVMLQRKNKPLRTGVSSASAQSRSKTECTSTTTYRDTKS